MKREEIDVFDINYEKLYVGDTVHAIDNAHHKEITGVIDGYYIEDEKTERLVHIDYCSDIKLVERGR